MIKDCLSKRLEHLRSCLPISKRYRRIPDILSFILKNIFLNNKKLPFAVLIEIERLGMGGGCSI